MVYKYIKSYSEGNFFHITKYFIFSGHNAYYMHVAVVLNLFNFMDPFNQYSKLNFSHQYSLVQKYYY